MVKESDYVLKRTKKVEVYKLVAYDNNGEWECLWYFEGLDEAKQFAKDLPKFGDRYKDCYVTFYDTDWVAIPASRI